MICYYHAYATGKIETVFMKKIHSLSLLVIPIFLFQSTSEKSFEKFEDEDLLDSAAIVKGIGNTSFSEDTDIFIPEEKDGTVLLMVNPAYFRKDLPKYIPQFMIARIQGGESGLVSERYFAKMIKKNFHLRNCRQ